MVSLPDFLNAAPCASPVGEPPAELSIEAPTMRLTRLQFTIRSLMTAVAATALLIAGGIFLLELLGKLRPNPPRPLPATRKSYIIMEGVDINSNGH
jgi:hypothetical protein